MSHCELISRMEWKKVADKKIPYRIFLKNEEPFAFAGIWDTWGEGKDQFYSCCIITCSPNKLVSGIHDIICTN